MKTVTKFLTLTLMTAAFGAMSVLSINAQATDEVCKPLYEKFLEERKGPDLAKLEAAVTTGKEFNSKCAAWEGQDAAVKYVAAQVPKLEQRVATDKKQRDIYEPYNKSIPGKDWATAFRLGKVIANDLPDDVDTPLVLASVGFDLTVAKPPVDTYNADTIAMAKLALQRLEQGKGSGSGEFGNFRGYTYKTAECADGKVNATGWMNYIIGDIMMNRMNQKKDALPYLYKASQMGCETKDRVANVYRNIGNYYVEEFVRIEKDKNEAYSALEKLKTDDPTFADTKKKYEDLVALQKGYMERVMDAFARAYRAAVNKKEPAAFATAQLNRAKEFYGFRFGPKPTVSFDSWLSGMSGKPFPDPTTAVTPVVEAETTTTTAPTAMTAATETPATDTRARTVTTGTTAKTATTTTAAKTTATTAKTTTKAPAKKPAPKKKGN
jgi:hypothetical protein